MPLKSRTFPEKLQSCGVLVFWEVFGVLVFRKSLLAAACCLLVTGCASMGGEENASGAVPESKPLLEGSYPEMAREMSGGSVQLYGLDGDVAPPLAPAPVVPRHDGGVVAGLDPNVTVYPFGDGGAVGGLVPPPARYEYGSGANSNLLPAPPASVAGVSLIDEMQPSSPYSAPYSVSGAEGDVRIYFRHGSARLTPHDIEAIRRAVSMPGGRIVVEGHASHKTGVSDPVESSIVNLKMSMDRAFAVSSALIRGGVPLSRIETRAFGDAQPSTPADGKNSESSSRRVDILTGQPVMAGY